MLLVAMAAFGGGVLSAVLGFLDSKEIFDVRKFGKSVGFALLAGLGFAVTYQLAGAAPETKDIFLAVMSGAGWDVVTNRLTGAMK